jgi:cytochrome c551/c552
MLTRFLLIVSFTCLIGLSFAQKDDDKEVKAILKKYACTKCHHKSIRLIGPSFTAISKREYSKERLVELIMNPEPGSWPGYGEMPKIDTLKRGDVEKVADWVRTIK